MATKERGFFGKVVVSLLAICALVGLIAMILSVLSPYVNPSRFVWLAFFGLAFWEILLFNILVFFLLLLMWSRRVWIAVLALVVAIPGINKSYSFGSKMTSTDSLKVMSYNVHMFQPLDEETTSEGVCDKVINVVREQSPDVLCCQEFTSFKKRVSRANCIELFAKGIDLPYVYYNKKSNYAGNVIFSKWPIAKVSEDSGFGQENKYGVMVSVDAGENGTFYLANVHLTSYNLTNNEIEVIMKPSEQRNSLDSVGMSVARKLKYAYQKRGDEIATVLQAMPPINGPIFMCGDFNDTPMSYVYRQMLKAGFTDTFTKVGRGIKPTYAGKLPLLRIDYIWANEKVQPLRCDRIRTKASDHYPVILEFTLNNNK